MFVISSSSETPATLWRRSSTESVSAWALVTWRVASWTSVPMRVTNER